MQWRRVRVSMGKIRDGVVRRGMGLDRMVYG